MSFVLGVDGGNTKTLALVAQLDGTIVGSGRSGCSDIYGAASPEAAIQAVYDAANSALKMAGIQNEALQAACFSMAGADWPEDFEFLQQAFARISPKITIVNDAIGALRAGSSDGTGVIVVCGTGVATGARNASGQIWHSSFWQEPQGAQELGRKTLRAVYRAALRVDPPTTLTGPVLRFFGSPSVDELLHCFTSRTGRHPDMSEVAKLPRILFEEAVHGDAAALRIIEIHGAALGDYALAAARFVNMADQPFDLILSGGVFRQSGRLLADALIKRVQSTSAYARPVFSRFEPVVGALLLAVESTAVAVTDQMYERLAVSLPPISFFET